MAGNDWDRWKVSRYAEQPELLCMLLMGIELETDGRADWTTPVATAAGEIFMNAYPEAIQKLIPETDVAQIEELRRDAVDHPFPRIKLGCTAASNLLSWGWDRWRGR
jgi:hypothetical protein